MRNDLLNTAAARIVTGERVTKMPKTGRMAPEIEVAVQLFILSSSQSDSTALPSFLDTYATRLLAEPLSPPNTLEPARSSTLTFAKQALNIVVLHKKYIIVDAL